MRSLNHRWYVWQGITRWMAMRSVGLASAGCKNIEKNANDFAISSISIYTYVYIYILSKSSFDSQLDSKVLDDHVYTIFGHAESI